GLARSIIESGFDIDVRGLLSLARNAALNACVLVAGKAVADAKSDKERALASKSHDEAIAVRDGDAAMGIDELYDFILDRLKGYYADKGVPTSHFNAVAELKPASLYDFDRRLDAIGTFAQLPEAEALAAAIKRIRNILRKAEGDIPGSIDPALLREPAESELAEAVTAAIDDTGTALAQKDYVAVLGRLARLRPQV